MIKIFKILFFIFILIASTIAILSFASINVFAQSCAGSTTCNYQQYWIHTFNDDQGDTCNDCMPFMPNDSYACTLYVAQYGCGQCVPAQMFCSSYNTVLGTVNGRLIECDRSYDTTWFKFYPNGSCSDSEDFCPNGCTSLCNSGKVCSNTCYNLVEPANDCGTAFGYRTCNYTQPQTCTTKSAGTISCSDVYDNCNYGAGYACIGGNTCEKTMGGRVTNAETGAGISGISISTTRGSDTTDANGYWSVGGFPYGTAFIINPDTSGFPCSGGYVCGGTSPTSPNPGSRSGTVGGGGDCGMSCNFTYTPGHIAGHVYIDYNHDGSKNYNDIDAANITISTTNPNISDTTDATGAYALNYVNDGSHTVSITVPAGYVVEGSASRTITIGPNNFAVDFYLTPLYTIQGQVCNDTGIDGSCLQSDDSVYPGTNSIIITRATADGTNVGSISQAAYQAGVQVLSGTYTVSYSTANGYYFTASKVPGKTVPPYTIAVGQSSYIDGSGHKYTCTTPPAGTTDASCGGGDMSNLNFAISNLLSWWQGGCTDLRLEATGLDDHLPNNGSCTDSSSGISTPNGYAIVCMNNPSSTGVYFAGQNSPTFGYNGGQASSPNYIASAPFSENFSPVSGVNRASYSYLMDTATAAGITPTDLSGIDPASGVSYCSGGGISDCDFEPNIPDGFYIAKGDLTLDLSRALPDPGKNKSFVFLATGKITITSNILVPTDTSAVFASKADMLVAGNVGQDLANYSYTSPNLEGFYSTEGNFIVESDNNTGFMCGAGGAPLDKRLNILGGVVVGGSFQNQRELCRYDASCPTTTFTSSYSYILNAPAFIKHKAQLWQETAPNGN